MYNWSIDEKSLKKDKAAYKIWKLEQAVNFGIGDEKIRKSDLKKYWFKLKIDPYRKKFLALLIDER